MMKNKIINKIQREIDSLEGMKLFVSRLPDLSDIPGLEVRVDGGCVHVVMPFDWSLYRTVRSRFKGWKRNGYWTVTQHDGAVSQHSAFYPADGRRLYFQGPYVSLCLRSGLEGSVCHLEQVGVREVPQYKVVCR